MTVNINAANISSVRMAEQSSAPASSGGATRLYVNANGDLAWIKDSNDITSIVSAAGASRTLTIPATGTASLLGESQVFTGVNTFRSNFIAQQDDSTHDSNRAGIIHYANFIPTVSLGAILTIPIISQNSYNERTLLIIRGVSAEVNTTTPKAFGVDVMFSSQTTLGTPTAYNGFGNYSSVTTSGMNLQINLTTAYTGGTLSKGVALYIQKISMSFSDVVNWSGIVLN